MSEGITNLMYNVANRIKILEEMLSHENTNKKAIIKKLIFAYETLENYAEKEEDKEIYRNIIETCKKIDDDNENLRYDSMMYYKLFSKKWNKNHTNKFKDHSLTYRNEFGTTSIISYFTDCKEEEFHPLHLDELIGKYELFIKYHGELDSVSFMEFEDFASKNALCVRMIQTNDGEPIYYYGGRNYEEVLKVMNDIEEDTKENGVSFDFKAYQKNKRMSVFK